MLETIEIRRKNDSIIVKIGLDVLFIISLILFSIFTEFNVKSGLLLGTGCFLFSFRIFLHYRKLSSNEPEIIIEEDKVKFLQSDGYETIPFKKINEIEAGIRGRSFSPIIVLFVKDGSNTKRLEFDMEYSEMSKEELRDILHERVFFGLT